MNAHAGIRDGHCQHRGCTACTAYTRLDGPGEQPCRCSHSRRWHSQVFRDGEPQGRFEPIPTTAHWWDAGAA